MEELGRRGKCQTNFGKETHSKTPTPLTPANDLRIPVQEGHKLGWAQVQRPLNWTRRSQSRTGHWIRKHTIPRWNLGIDWERETNLIVITHLFLRQKAITLLLNLCLLHLGRLLNRRFSRETKLLYPHGLDPKIRLSAEWKRIWISMCRENIKDLPGTHFGHAKNSSQWILQKHFIKIVRNNKL